MKAAILNDFGSIVCKEVPTPGIGREEALVKVLYGGICGTDNHVYLGHHPTATTPRVLGHEFVGELVDIDTSLDIGIKKGDKVVVQPYYACGVCEPCITGSDNVCDSLKILGVHQDGCFAQYVTVPSKKLYRLPEGVDLKMATLIEPIAVAVHDVWESGLRVDDTVLVIGGGPIGLLIALIARTAGAKKILISEVNEYRLAVAEKMGFDVINPVKQDVMEETSKQTDGKGFNVVFEASGTKSGAAVMTEAAATRGTIVVVGVPSDIYPINSGKMLAKELKMIGVRIHSQAAFKHAVSIVGSRVIEKELNLIIDKEFSYKQMSDAMKFSLEDAEHIKICIRVDHE